MPSPSRPPTAAEAAAVAWFASLDAVDAQRADLKAEQPNWSTGQINYVIANDVIARVMGHQWWLDNLGTDKAPRPDYLRVHPADRPEKYEHFQRVMELGRRLFELEGEPWFPSLVKGLSSRDLQGAAFEAEVVRMMLSSALKVRLRDPQGVKGEDYDIEVSLGTRLWSIEVKTRVEGMPYKPGAITSTLRTARKQLPRDGLGSIFLRVPEVWVGDGRYRREHADEIATFLRRTNRVHAVVLVWDEWRDRTFGGRVCRRRHRAFHNDDGDPDVRYLLDFLDRIWDGPGDLFGPVASF